MITKLEELYLNILRYAVVIVAGLSLIVAIASLVFAGTSLLPSMFNGQTELSGGNLKEFIDEQKSTAKFESSETNETNEVSNGKYESPFIKEAVNITMKYLEKLEDVHVDRTSMVAAFESQLEEIEFADREDYKTSFLSLLKQLDNSKGEPLSVEKLGELIEWHNENFKSEAMNRNFQSTTGEVDSWGWITMAGSAFLVFIMIAFYFLFVRVERHLRLVNVVRTDAENEIEAEA